MKKVFIIILFIFSGLSFYFFPHIDIAFSSLFFEPHIGFYPNSNLFIKIFYNIVYPICYIYVLFAGLYSLKILIKTKSLNLKYYKKVIYVTLVCLIGPGLIVHVAFKESFNRARPLQITEFGGKSNFAPAFVISNQCSTNCSFVSGHASVGFMFFSLAFLLKGRKKNLMLIFSTTLGMLIGLARIMEGAHFLSDVIVAGIIVFVTAYLLDILIKPLEESNT